MNIQIYPGSSSFQPGQTPFGFYDTDFQFQTDSDKFTTFASRRLGYPIMEVELQDINFYAAFEEAREAGICSSQADESMTLSRERVWRRWLSHGLTQWL
jgi:hypothetical protein